MTVLDVIQRSAEFLARKGVESPRLQVELLLAHVLQVPRLKLYLDFERKLLESELDRVRELVKRRANREPLQHLTGAVSFCGIEIRVSPAALIPRPETESLAELGWKFLKGRAAARNGAVRALDIGTGTGCLAIALATHVPEARLVAVDISEAALGLARENTARLGLAERIEFQLGAGFAGVPRGEPFDLIISNPPYIPTPEIAELAPEVRDHDPRLALDGGEDGLAVIRQLAAEGQAWLAPGGQLLCEFGDDQGEAVRREFEQRQWTVRPLVQDLTGRARIVVASAMES